MRNADALPSGCSGGPALNPLEAFCPYYQNVGAGHIKIRIARRIKALEADSATRINDGRAQMGRYQESWYFQPFKAGLDRTQNSGSVDVHFAFTIEDDTPGTDIQRNSHIRTIAIRPGIHR